MLRYLDDFELGASDEYGAYEVTEEEIIEFASQYDPQPFHVDPAAAAESPFDGLVASGWHTAAIAMRLVVTEGYLSNARDLIGMGLDYLRWTQPVRPGDTLSVREEIIELDPEVGGEDHGILKAEIRVRNQDDEEVLEVVWVDLVPRRPDAEVPSERD